MACHYPTHYTNKNNPMRYFLKLSYNGSKYHGWQKQPHDITVQETIENALSTILRRQTQITGAGRTDTAVNATTMYAHFDTDTPIDNTTKNKLITSLNSILPHDIAIQDIIPVKNDAHARYDATTRTYHYHIHTRKSPFKYTLSWQAPQNLDYELMNTAAKILLTTQDFTSFAKLHTDTLTNNCTVTQAQWIKNDEENYTFVITANRFLRNMVRAIVGTLLQVGLHKITISQFKQIINKKNRCLAGTSMPGNALFLQDITYPQDIFITNTDK